MLLSSASTQENAEKSKSLLAGNASIGDVPSSENDTAESNGIKI